ncbi:GNAT family N-acetyltransferase [Eggerthellaceae bacterium zg-893]|nr:GNAT family N-acetyltransferase [Eggerthellaceae bacterium zg-893]
MALEFRPYAPQDVPAMMRMWNVVVEAGDAFPQVEPLNETTADAFFAEQAQTVVACVGDEVLGLYILHPNNVGRCAHVANASYVVAKASRGLGLGRALVEDSLAQARRLGFRGLQFNAVVESNEVALHLYDSLGFTCVGKIPHGFINGAGQLEDMYIYYWDLIDGPAPAPEVSAEAPDEPCDEAARPVPENRQKGEKKSKKKDKGKGKKKQKSQKKDSTGKKSAKKGAKKK